MQKKYTSLGLMSGTSGDGVDASIIYSNGLDKFEAIKDKFFEYDSKIYKKIHSIKEKIFDENDLKNYPFDLKADKAFLSSFSKNVIVYNPDNDEMYPSGIKKNSYNFGSISHHMEGKFRPGHFNGVATVIEKLIKDIKPHNAYFGKKDYQQIQIIKALNKKN